MGRFPWFCNHGRQKCADTLKRHFHRQDASFSTVFRSECTQHCSYSRACGSIVRADPERRNKIHLFNICANNVWQGNRFNFALGASCAADKGAFCRPRLCLQRQPIIVDAPIFATSWSTFTAAVFIWIDTDADTACLKIDAGGSALLNKAVYCRCMLVARRSRRKVGAAIELNSKDLHVQHFKALDCRFKHGCRCCCCGRSCRADCG